MLQAFIASGEWSGQWCVLCQRHRRRKRSAMLTTWATSWAHTSLNGYFIFSVGKLSCGQRAQSNRIHHVDYVVESIYSRVMSEYLILTFVWETDRLCKNSRAYCKHVVLRASLSAQDMIQKVFAINSVCFNLLTKPDGQSLFHETRECGLFQLIYMFQRKAIS